jgi:hypothetical protein
MIDYCLRKKMIAPKSQLHILTLPTRNGAFCSPSGVHVTSNYSSLSPVGTRQLSYAHISLLLDASRTEISNDLTIVRTGGIWKND